MLRRAGASGDGNQVKAKSARAKGPWQMFVKEKKSGTCRTLKDIADEWHALPEAERRERCRRVPQDTATPARLPDAVRRARNTHGHAVWPHAGDDFYPVRPEVLADVPKHIGVLSQQWCSRIGSEVLRADRTIEAPVKHLCEEKYGCGVCSAAVSDEVKSKFETAHERLKRWCTLCRPKSAKFDTMWEPLGMLYFGPRTDPARGAGEQPPGLVALLLAAKLSPFTCVVCQRHVAAPQPGDRIDLTLDSNTLLSDVAITRCHS